MSQFSKKQALLHVIIPYLLCIATALGGFFDGVFTELGYEHYAERAVPWLPLAIAMPLNSLINLGYALVGVFWLCQDHPKARGKTSPADYFKDVFAFMAMAYTPVQWARIATQTHRSAILDQWFTLPIFAWVPAWCDYIHDGWKPTHLLKLEATSILSYSLALLHEQGFELTLGLHILLAVIKGVNVQWKYGDTTSLKYMCLGILSCMGFVILKLLDHWLAQWTVFQRLTGHFWSKVCDILQIHYSFKFLVYLTPCKQ
ncbi:transmembrane protein 187 [Latimeria chalumnae]|uniref:Transmembrane protein 187 n=1 Tax=Latimeria chalumnae TaxID=7897 RepID=H3B0E8_LATCH|nr:PREDICTED: transmembrane protein 187 [Latimeria chalumnae]|eukprot:XP_006001507.1 PREDICTED: transmembrane protein 187 [Latimeria chalumnae]